jgi:excinuclease ABC subunit C
MTHQEFTKLASGIPTEPGIYKYYNSSGTLIYVGKAKQLKKRISSYFNRTLDNQKTVELVKHIDRIEFTIVDNEADAFFLENSLIKEYQPHYNINLKDDKGYPFVVIKNERFPRVFITRRHIKDGSRYFGPYTSIVNVREMLDFIKQYFPLRNCQLNLSEKNIQKKKFKVCLEYHLGNCKGPCEGLQTIDEYTNGIEQLISLLKGNLQPLMEELKSKLHHHTENLEFEKAAAIHQKILDLQQYKAKSAVVNTKTGNVDIFSILEEGNAAFVNYLAVNDGSIIYTKTISLEKKLEETKEDILSLAIARLRETFNSDAKEIILPFELQYPDSSIIITVPKAGDKRKLLDLSIKNVNHFSKELQAKKMLSLEEKTNAEVENVLKQLQEDLQLNTFPDHIECFDNSNLHGTNAVAAMVCFKNGIPSKKDYRHFNIKTVEGINDFASMKEIVNRRYSKLISLGEPLPKLIIIDGGKGQLSAALESIHELGINGKTTLVGLAKNHEELFFEGDNQSIRLPWTSESLKLIRRIRDEVHRFGITFHRNQRSKNAIQNEIESIPGIGTNTAAVLLKKFKSVKKISKLSLIEIQQETGPSKAKIIYEYFHQKISKEL